MSIWAGLKNIVDTMNRGAHQDDWNKIAAQEEGIKSEQQRRLLASNADSRAAANESRDAEGYEYGKTRRGVREKADDLGLQAAEQGVATGAWNASTRDEDRTRKQKNEDAANARADTGLKLEAGRLSLAQKEALRMAGLTDMQINAMSAKQSEDDATRTGRIEAENYQNSEAGRTERSMGRWGAILKEMEDGPDKKAIIAFLRKQQGIPDEEAKPGMMQRWFGVKPGTPPGPSPFGENFVGRIR